MLFLIKDDELLKRKMIFGIESAIVWIIICELIYNNCNSEPIYNNTFSKIKTESYSDEAKDFPGKSRV